MNPISPLFGRNSNLTNQNPVTSVDKLVCAFDQCNSYIPRACVCVCVCVRARARSSVNAQCELHMYIVCVCVCMYVHCFCHYIKIMYPSYFIVYRTKTFPTVLLAFVYVKVLSLSVRITQTKSV